MHRVSGNGTRPPEGHTDPDYAPTVEVFDNLTHTDIQRGVLELRPEVLTQGRQAWQGSAAGVAEAVQSAHAEIRGAIADGWRGGAAQLAEDAVTAFERLGQQLSDVMAVVGQRLGQANDAAETLRATVSQQTVATPNLEAALLDPKQATTNATLQKSTESLRQDAVRVMETVYAGVFLRTGDNVPAFSEGSMYPDPAVVHPGPDDTAPGGGSADLAGDATTPKVLPTIDIRPGAASAVSPPAERADDPDRPGGDAPAAAVVPAAVTAPAAAVPMAPSAGTVPAAVPVAAVSAAEPVVTVSNPVAPQPNPPASPSPAMPSAPVAPAAAARVTPAGATGTAPASNPQNTEHDKRDDHDQDHAPGGDTMSGMGAGVMGGLAGGAFAAGDAVRQGPPGPVAVKLPRHEEDDDEDEDYYAEFEEEPTFLEPGEPGGELVGRLEPTTPPVLGEWSEDD